MISNDYLSFDLLLTKLKEAYGEVLLRRWLVQGEERYIKLATRKAAPKRFNANKALKELTDDDFKKLKSLIKE